MIHEDYCTIEITDDYKDFTTIMITLRDTKFSDEQLEEFMSYVYLKEDGLFRNIKIKFINCYNDSDTFRIFFPSHLLISIFISFDGLPGTFKIETDAYARSCIDNDDNDEICIHDFPHHDDVCHYIYANSNMLFKLAESSEYGNNNYDIYNVKLKHEDNKIPNYLQMLYQKHPKIMSYYQNHIK